MAKGAEKKKTNAMLNTAQGQSQNYTSNYLQTTDPERAQARANANDIYNTMTGGYKNLLNSPLLTFNSGGSSGGGGGGGGGAAKPVDTYGQVKGLYNQFAGGGGVNLGKANEAMGYLGNVASTGGWSPADRAAQQGLISGLTEFGKTGGLDATAIARMRGNGVFDEYAKTGGLSPTNIAMLRARGNASIPSFYANAAADAARMGRVTGQYNPAAMAKMARQGAQDAGAAALNTELGINEQVNQGRQWGASNVSSAEGNLQNLLTSNKMKGLTSAGDMRSNMLNSIAGNTTSAATPMGQLNIAGQELVQKGKMFGTQGLEGVADKQAAERARAAAASAASSAQSAADQKWAAQFQRQGQLAGLEGLGGLYTSNPAEVAYYDRARQEAVNSNIANTSGIAQNRMQNNPQRDWVSTAAQIGGGVIGGMTGLGAIGALGKGVQTGMKGIDLAKMGMGGVMPFMYPGR